MCLCASWGLYVSLCACVCMKTNCKKNINTLLSSMNGHCSGVVPLFSQTLWMKPPLFWQYVSFRPGREWLLSVLTASPSMMTVKMQTGWAEGRSKGDESATCTDKQQHCCYCNSSLNTFFIFGHRISLYHSWWLRHDFIHFFNVSQLYLWVLEFPMFGTYAKFSVALTKTLR